MDLYIFRDGQTLGPLTPEQARQGIQNGQFQLDDRAITRGLDEWKSLSEVLNLLSQQSTIEPSSTPFSTTPVTSVRGPVSSQTNATPWLIGGIYALCIMAFAGMMGKFLEEHKQQIPDVDFFHSVFNFLALVSFVGLIAGLISPKIFANFVSKFPALTRFSKNGLERKHVSYVFGTAFILCIGLTGGTDVKGQQERERFALAQKTKLAQEAQQNQAKASVEKARKLTEAQNQKKVLLAQQRVQAAEDRARQAEEKARQAQERADQAQQEAPEPTAVPVEDTEPFVVKITYDDQLMRIANPSNNDWTNCRVQINPKFFGSGYEHTISLLKAGNYVTVPVAEFTNSNDERFSSERLKIEKVRVFALVNGKSEVYTGAARD